MMSGSINDPPYSLEEILALLNEHAHTSKDERAAFDTLLSAVVRNPHIGRLVRKARKGAYPFFKGREFIKMQQYAYDPPLPIVRGGRGLVYNNTIIHWLDPERAVRLRGLLGPYIWCEMRLVNLRTLRAFGVRLRDLILSNFVGLRTPEHACVSDMNMNHRDLLIKYHNVTWEFLCELNAAASAADLRAVHDRAPWYLPASQVAGYSRYNPGRRDYQFVCDVCASTCPNIPLDYARERRLYKYARFWACNMFIDLAFVRECERAGRDVNWHMLSENRAIWQNVDYGEAPSRRASILSEYHERLISVDVAKHAPLQLVYKYWPREHTYMNWRVLVKNPTCPRSYAREQIDQFAEIALPQDELNELLCM